MSWADESRQQKHTQHAPSTKTECDCLYGWLIKKGHICKITIKMVNPRDIAENAEEEEEFAVIVMKRECFSMFVRDLISRTLH